MKPWERYKQAPAQVSGEAPGGTLRGISDPISGIAQYAEQVLPASVSGPINQADQWLYEQTNGLLGNQYSSFDEGLKAQEADYQQQRAAAGETGMDWDRLGGNLLSAAPLMAVGGGATLPARLGIGSAMGAGEAVTMPAFGEDYWKEKAQQAVWGAGGGAIGGGISSMLGRAAKPQTDEAVQLLMGEGVTPMPGQIAGGMAKTLEEKASSIPLVGDVMNRAVRRQQQDLNRAAYNRVLKPLGQTADDYPIGHEGVDKVYDAIGKSYDEVLPKLTYEADDVFNRNLDKLRSDASVYLEPAAADEYNRILDEIFLPAINGVADGRAIKRAESKLNTKATNYVKSQDTGKQEMGHALDEVLGEFRESLLRMNPDYAPELKRVNEGYANYTILRNASARANAEGGFTASQLDQAVKAQDQSLKKGKYARGQALMQDLSSAGKQVLADKYPDSGTAGRALGALMLGGSADLMGAGGLNSGILLGGMGAYSNPAQKAIAAAMTKRPAGASAISELLQRTTPAYGPLAERTRTD